MRSVVKECYTVIVDALQWGADLNISHVIFEVDCKNVFLLTHVHAEEVLRVNRIGATSNRSIISFFFPFFSVSILLMWRNRYRFVR